MSNINQLYMALLYMSFSIPQWTECPPSVFGKEGTNPAHDSAKLLKWNSYETCSTPSLYVLVSFLDLTVHNAQKHSCHFKLTDQQKHHINLFSHNL